MYLNFFRSTGSVADVMEQLRERHETMPIIVSERSDEELLQDRRQ